MSPFIAFILGIMVVLVPLLIFYIFQTQFTGANRVWRSIFCSS